MKNISLIIQIIHLIIIFCVTLTPLLTNKYDMLYLIILFLIILHWNIFKGECILSYYEKKYLYPNYKMGDFDSSPFKKILGTNTTNTIIYFNGITILLVLQRNYGTKYFPIMFCIFCLTAGLFYTSTKIKFNKTFDESKL